MVWTLNEWRRQGYFMETAAGQVFYQTREHRSGEVLLLLHGFPTASWDWHKLWGHLSERFSLLAPDFLGLGYSDKPLAHEYTIAGQADMAEALLEHLGVSEYHILAHDYGDTVAQELLARDAERAGPLRVQSVVLLNGGLFPEVHQPRPVQKLLLGPLGPYVSGLLGPRALQRNFRAIFGPGTQPGAGELSDWWSLIQHQGGARVLHRLLRYMPERQEHRARWVGALAEAPVLARFIVGLADPISGALMAQRYRELVPEADVVALPGIGHYPQVEAPMQVLEHALSFWDSL